MRDYQSRQHKRNNSLPTAQTSHAPAQQRTLPLQLSLAQVVQQAQAGEASPDAGAHLEAAMRAKFEQRFGMRLDHVRVHRNSPAPAQFAADAYTYGSEIFLAPGQESCLDHELAHVAQQSRGQVFPTGMEHGLSINTDPALEQEAENGRVSPSTGSATKPVVQCCGRRRWYASDDFLTCPRVYRDTRSDERYDRWYDGERSRYISDDFLAYSRAYRDTRFDERYDRWDDRERRENYDRPCGNRDSDRRSPQSQRNCNRKYFLGQHGYKISEQKRLTELYDSSVSGKTHESEHVIGFAALNRSHQKREELTSFDKALPAYQEVYAMHRAHIGTGYNREGTYEQMGFSSDKEYRDAQYNAMAASDISSAIQLNQLGYAALYQERKNLNSTDIKQANNSFYHMIKELHKRNFLILESPNGLPLLRYERYWIVAAAPTQVECVLSRLTMQTGIYPSVYIENQVRNLFGLSECHATQSEPTEEDLRLLELLEDMVLE